MIGDGERLEPADGDERKVGTVTASVSIGTARRSNEVFAHAAAAGIVPQPPPADDAGLLVARRPDPSRLVLARDMDDVHRKVGR